MRDRRGRGSPASRRKKRMSCVVPWQHSAGNGTIHTLKDDFIEGMVKNGYELSFAERCFKQIEGFGEYGFPESHAASFALPGLRLFLCEALLSRSLRRRPAQLATHGFLCAGAADPRRARTRRRGTPTRHQCEHLDCTLERRDHSNRCALRLGLRSGDRPLSEVGVDRMVAQRTTPYRDPADLWRRSGLTKRQIRGVGARRCFRFARPVPPRRVVGGAWLFRSAAPPLLDGPGSAGS